MRGTIVAVLVRRPPRGPAADARAVTRQIRRVVWPRLRDAGFEGFTGRNAWRYVGDDVDLVNFQSFGGTLSDAVGCTSFSFGVNLGVCRPADAPSIPARRDAQGRPQPRDYECVPHRRRLHKSLSQPWFQPFRQDVRRWPLSFRLHREGLKRVLRTETHDRSDIWFVLPDGSNLDECVQEAVAAIAREGLSWFDSLRERSDQPQ
jgi:hypothetical protein